MRRILAVALLSCGVLLVFGPAALAKGPLSQTTGRVVITGPGLDRDPIATSWEGSCFVLDQGVCTNESVRQIDLAGGMLGDASGDFWTVATATGLTAVANGNLANAFPPAKGAALGPKYQITWVISMAAVESSFESHPGMTETIVMDLYPFAPKAFGVSGTEPWAYTPPGQMLFGNEVGSGWWPADLSFFQFLAARGLPATAPLAVNPVAVEPVANQPVAITVWPIWIGAGLLLAMVLAAIGVGRRAAGRHSIPPAAAA